MYTGEPSDQMGWPTTRLFNNCMELQITALSKERIPFMAGNAWDRGMAKARLNRQTPRDEILVLGPANVISRKALLLTLEGPIDVTIPICNGDCTCGASTKRGCKMYDGADDRVLNLDGVTL